ncbi:MAG: YjgP/YjgQ family permease [Campylobacteraceae bacterium]|nr:YjgP/YjgQ family permease [Campylobacteraceae bacterium]
MKIKQYLFSNIAHTFFPIILGLFFITSIIFLVKIASLTSVITLNGRELFTLYLYILPEIIFYTVPISFFISLVISLGKLSHEYELIVITSFGLNPLKIAKMLFPICFLMSLSLLVVSVGLIPKTNYLTASLLNDKKKEANFNIKASEFGQKFGPWLIYIEKKKDNKFTNVTLFKTDKKVDQFILSEEAELKNDKGNLSFILKNGKSFFIENNIINQIDFKEMNISDSLSGNKLREFTNSYNFWVDKLKKDKDLDDLSFYILVSIFPCISLLFVIAYGYFNPRYDKNSTTMYAVIIVVLFYIFAKKTSDKFELEALYIVTSIWILLSYLIYYKKIKSLY